MVWRSIRKVEARHINAVGADDHIQPGSVDGWVPADAIVLGEDDVGRAAAIGRPAVEQWLLDGTSRREPEFYRARTAAGEWRQARPRHIACASVKGDRGIRITDKKAALVERVAARIRGAVGVAGEVHRGRAR